MEKDKPPMNFIRAKAGSAVYIKKLRADGSVIEGEDWKLLGYVGPENIPSTNEVEETNVTMTAKPIQGIVLDPGDPFESALIQMVQTNRAKRRDYAVDGSPFSNFEETAAGMNMQGFGPIESSLFNVLQKLARIRSLRANGRVNDPANESVLDTYLDLAVYAVITYAIAKQKLEK